MAIIPTIVFAATVSGAYMAYKTFRNVNPGPAKVIAEVKEMMQELVPSFEDFVPISKTELELLSHSQTNKEYKKSIAIKAKGILTSIYDEPMIAYVYKRYVGDKENSALFARTANQEIFYRKRKGEVRVTFNNQALGIIRDNGILYSPGSNKPLAKIVKLGKSEFYPIFVGEKEIASMTKDDKTIEVNSRALEFVSEMNAEEEMLLLAILTRELILEDFPTM